MITSKDLNKQYDELLNDVKRVMSALLADTDEGNPVVLDFPVYACNERYDGADVWQDSKEGYITIRAKDTSLGEDLELCWEMLYMNEMIDLVQEVEGVTGNRADLID